MLLLKPFMGVFQLKSQEGKEKKKMQVLLMFKIRSFPFSCCRHGCHFRAPQPLRLSSSFSTAAAAASPSYPPSNPHHFIVDYLVEKLGFSSEKAIKASKYLSSLKSLEKPESFMGFMGSHGFSHAHIKKILSWYPKCLLLNVEKTLAPKFQSFKDLGFSGSDLVELINSNNRLIGLNFNSKVLPRIQFWLGLIGSRDRLIRLCKQNNNFILHSIENNVMSNISFLRSCGVSDEKIRMAVRHSPRFIVQRPQSMVEAADRVDKEMGIARGSGMYIWALLALNKVSKVRLNENLETMKKFGWSEAEFVSASCKAPVILTLSQKNLVTKMEFLLKEAECKPSYVAKCPLLLMYSLEKRLIPRYNVIKILMRRGLLTKELKLLTIMNFSEKVFMNKFIVPYKHKVPELLEIYMDGCRK